MGWIGRFDRAKEQHGGERGIVVMRASGTVGGDVYYIVGLKSLQGTKVCLSAVLHGFLVE